MNYLLTHINVTRDCIFKYFCFINVLSSGNVRTVETIADLQKALKSEDDVQIVVPNELLETTEFKTFISNFNSFPINDRHQNVPPLSSSSKESKSSNVKRELAENPSFQQTMEGVIPGNYTFELE